MEPGEGAGNETHTRHASRADLSLSAEKGLTVES